MNPFEHPDFTEARYRAIVRTARQTWQFIRYGEASNEVRSTLWRHDVDFSMHRAAALADIEHEEGVVATYFVLLRGSFYNALERSVARQVERILALGHRIGLHFDPGYYGLEASDTGRLEDFLAFERSVIERSFGTSVEAFSWHNPTIGAWHQLDADTMGGMINAYGRSITNRYVYVSDSNGVWRHRDLADVVLAGREQHLQVLTHPNWWCPTPLLPRDRIRRAIDGRAQATLAQYDALLETNGRPNVGAGKSPPSTS